MATTQYRDQSVTTVGEPPAVGDPLIAFTLTLPDDIGVGYDCAIPVVATDPEGTPRAPARRPQEGPPAVAGSS